MSKATYYHIAGGELVEGTALGRITVVLGADFDRVTAERDALQERLGDMNDRFVRTKAARLRSCRLAIAKNQLAKQQHAEVIGLQELLNAADQEKDDLSFQLNDREGSRYSWLQGAQAAEKRVEVLEGLLRHIRDTTAGPAHRQRIEVALSASAEPSAAKCKTCNGSKVVDDGELTHSAGGIPYECGPIKCVKDCPDCGDTGLEPCSKHGWKP